MSHSNYALSVPDTQRSWYLSELWVTEDKNIIPIVKLAYPHMLNIIAYFKKNPERLMDGSIEARVLRHKLNRIEELVAERRTNVHTNLKAKAITVSERLDRASVYYNVPGEVSNQLKEARQLILDLAQEVGK